MHDAGGKSKPRWPAGSLIQAEFSSCGCYRWSLSEIWNPQLGMVTFLLMNPSVAGIDHSDPTLMKTGRFARSWGFGGQWIGNIHAYRATDSADLLSVADPVGAGNDAAILAMALQSDMVVLAYGQPKPKALRARGPAVVARLRQAGIALSYLKLAQDGTPYHPLYLPGSLQPLAY